MIDICVMVAEKYNISAFPLRSTRLGDHRLPNGSGKDVQAANGVGIGGVPTPHTPEQLVRPIGPGSMSTRWTFLRSVGRVYFHQANTVLSGFQFNPVEHKGICPGGQGLAKTLPSSRVLSLLEIPELFNGKESHFLPWKLIQGVVNKLVPSSDSLSFSNGPRFLSTNTCTNLPHLLSVKTPIGRGQELVESDVQPEINTLFLGRKVGTLDPDRDPIFPGDTSDGTATLEVGVGNGKEFPEVSSTFQGDINSLSFFEGGESQPEVELCGFLGGGDFSKLLREDHRPTKDRAGRLLTGTSGTCLGSCYDPESLLKGMGTHPEAEVSKRYGVLGLFVEVAPIDPDVPDVGVDSRSVTVENGYDLGEFTASDELETQFVGSNHDGIVARHLRLVKSFKRFCRTYLGAEKEN